MTTTAASTAAPEAIVISPSYKLPIALLCLSVPLFFVQGWVCLAIALFGFFLLVQAATLRLSFTETALDIERGQRLIRRFPYQNWQHWRVFWSPVPILFYFREVNSIHFLPVLFDPKTLQACLEARCPRML